jgi:hypothetical protein
MLFAQLLYSNTDVFSILQNCCAANIYLIIKDFYPFNTYTHALMGVHMDAVIYNICSRIRKNVDITDRYLHHIFTNSVHMVIAVIIRYPRIKHWVYVSLLNFLWVFSRAYFK